MIYTVTLNPAIDKTVKIPAFTAGIVNRVQQVREDAGGKGINVSKCLRALGEPSVAVMLLAGETGSHLEKMAQSEELTVLPFWTEGQTRTNLKVVDTQLGQNTDINEPGPGVTEQLLEQLLEKLCLRLQTGDIVVLAGSLPKGAPVNTYGNWTARLQEKGARVFLDADGACMAEGIRQKPWLIKPNETELGRVLGRETQSREQILDGAKLLLEQGIRNVVVSMGGNGGCFLWQEEGYWAKSLSVPVLSTVGAGDSVVAAMAYALSRGLPKEEQIRLAMAMGAASVMLSGTQAPDRETVFHLAQQVELEKI